MKLLNKKYIVKQSSGKEWYFFYKENTGICYANIINKRIPNLEILFADGMGDFDVVVDKNDCLHLICQDASGNIVYLIYRNDKWLKYVILESKSQNTYPKHFKILFIDDSINLFYVINHNDNKLLTHQIITNSNHPPTIVGVISEHSIPFHLSYDNEGDIFVYYANKSTENRIGYSKYISNKKEWAKFVTIDHMGLYLQPPYVAVDSNNTAHSIHIKEDNNRYSIVYSNYLVKISENPSSPKETIISSDFDLNSLPILILTNNRIWVLWLHNRNVISCFSEDNGVTWSNPSQFMSGRNSKIVKFGYRTNRQEEMSNIIADTCYGYIIGSTVNLYILSNYIDTLRSVQTKNTNIKNNSFKNNNHNNLNNTSSGAIPSNTVKSELNNKNPTEEKDFQNNLASLVKIEITKINLQLNFLKEELLRLNKKVDMILNIKCKEE